MQTQQLSTCFCTKQVTACRDFYIRFFSAKAVFDCGWYVTVSINQTGPELSFIEPQGEMPEFAGAGVMLNFKVADVGAEYARLTRAGLAIAMPLEDHPWGDRGFSVVDPIGNTVYVYSDREPSAEFAQFISS